MTNIDLTMLITNAQAEVARTIATDAPNIKWRASAIREALEDQIDDPAIWPHITDEMMDRAVQEIMMHPALRNRIAR